MCFCNNLLLLSANDCGWQCTAIVVILLPEFSFCRSDIVKLSERIADFLSFRGGWWGYVQFEIVFECLAECACV